MASSLFDLLEVLGANMVVDVVCVLSCGGLIFSQTASGILLCSVFCSRIGEASVKRWIASLFQTAIISMLQAWLEKLRCTPFYEVGIANVSFILGMKPSVVQYFGLSCTSDP